MERYDAVIVGARCAGSTAAIALAKGGWDVLLIDRDEFPSDTVSTHTVFPNTVARLDELGALDRLDASHDVPRLEHRASILGHEITGGWAPFSGHDDAIAPRRIVLDQAMLETAVAAGAEARLGEQVIGLLGAGIESDPVRGVRTEGGGEIEAGWVLAADGRPSRIAKWLGLEEVNPMKGEFSILYGYWRGLPDTPYLNLEANREHAFNDVPCEDGLHLVIYNGPPDATRGDRATRERRYQEGVRSFPDTTDPEAFDEAELVSEIQPAPETMMRGFYRRPNGPGWVLIGDASHFKHPATAQGISDAIEQALHVSEALLGQDPGLSGYERWRDERAAEHYEWSFDMGRFPRDAGKVMFAALEREPETAQMFRETFTRRLKPKTDVFNKERMTRWFAEAEAATA